MTTRIARPKEAVVLAAGRGTRLRPVTQNRPKCLVEVGGQPVLRRLIHQLETLGIERVVVVTGHCHEMVKEALSSQSISVERKCVFNPEFDTTNNAVSLARAIKELSRDRFLLCDGDVVLRSRRLLEPLMEAPEEAVVAYRRCEMPPREAMKVVVEEGRQKRIHRVGKSLRPEGCDGEALGLQKIGPSVVDPLLHHLESLDEGRRKNWYYEDVFAELIDRGVEFHGCELPGRGWAEIDTPVDLERARRLVARWNAYG